MTSLPSRLQLRGAGGHGERGRGLDALGARGNICDGAWRYSTKLPPMSSQIKFQLQADYRAGRRPAAGHRAPGRRPRERACRPDAARRHRLGQDLHHRQRHPAGAAPDAGARAQQDAGGAAVRRVHASSSRTTRSSISSPTTTTTSPRPTCRPRDTYIEKDASINEHIEQMRLSATKALLERKDSIIVATVSSIYGLGDPQAYLQMVLHLKRGDKSTSARCCGGWPRCSTRATTWTSRRAPIACAAMSSTSSRPSRSAMRCASSCSTTSSRSLALFDPLTGEVRAKIPRYTVYPGTHYVTPKDRLVGAIDQIREDLRVRLQELYAANKLVEAQRLEQRTTFDLEMIKEVGYCPGIENYSRYLSGRAAGRAAAVPVRLPAARRAADRRRKPPDDSAARRHVQGRPLAQGNAGRIRLPPAIGARQPAAEVRGVGSASRRR